MSNDITERKQKEEQLYESEFRFSKLYENGPFGMVMADKEFRFRKANPAFCTIMGYTEDEIRKLTFKDITHPDDLKKDLPNIQKLIRNEIQVYKTEKRYIRKDGQVIWGSLSVTANYDSEDQFLYNLGIIEDITWRKQSEEELRKSKKMLSETESIGRVGGWEFNIDTMDQTWTEEVYRIHEVDFDFNPNVDKGINFYTPASKPVLERAVKRVIEFGEPFDMDLEIITAKGNLRKVHSVGKPDLENRRVYGFFQDITERKQVEEQLRQSEERLSKMFNLGPVAKVLTRISDNVVVDFNPACESLFGYDRENYIGKSVNSFDFWLDRDHMALTIEKFFKQGYLHGVEFQFKTTHWKIGWASIYAERIEVEGEKYILSEFVDITDRKVAEEELHERENKLSTILSLLPVGISILDQEQKIVYENPALENILGITKEGLQHGDYRQRKYLKSDGTPKPMEEFASARVFNEKTAMHNIITGIVKEDGNTVWTNVNAVPVEFPDWKVVLVTADITDLKIAKEKAEESKLKLDVALSSMTDAIFISDLEGQFIDFNEAFATFHRFKNKEECARTFAEYPAILDVYLPTGELATVEQWAVPRALNGEIVKNAEYTLHRKDTGETWIGSYSFSPIRDKDGLINGSVVTARDITEQKQAQEKIRQKDQEFRKLSANVPDLIYQFTRRPDGTYFVPIASEGIRNIFGCSPEDVLNDFGPIGRVIYPEDMERVIREIEYSAEHLTYFTCEFRVHIPGKEIQWIYSNSTPEKLPDGSVTWYGFNVDITNKKLAEEALRESERKFRKLNEKLEERVEERTLQLREANQEMEAFSYSVSHDLRSPLRHINGFAEILAKQYSDKLPEDARKHLNTITGSAKIMGTLIDDLLSFSRTGRYELKKSTLKMNQVIDDALVHIRPSLEDRKIDWEISQLPEVQGDYNLMRMVWINLLDNAVKYTRTKEKAVIKIGYKDEKQAIVFFIKDNGAGFDMKYAHKLFGVFQRLHSSKQFEGTGIGLANVRRIVLRHGGKTWAEAKTDIGATFYFSIPKEMEDKR